MTGSHEVDWTEEKVVGFWDDLSRRLPSGYFSAVHAPALAAWIDRRAQPGRERLVDVGCGTGELLAELTKRGYKPLGVDSSPVSIREAGMRIGENNVRLGSATEIPIESGSASGVLLIETLEHILEPDLEATMTEIKRVLKVGQPLVITTPNAEDLQAVLVRCPDCGAVFHPMQHVRSWTAPKLTEFLETQGFHHVLMYETRLPRGRGLPAFARRCWYQVRRERPHLLAVARA